MKARIVLALLGVVSILSCRGEAPAAPESVDPAYVAEIDAWHSDRLEGLRSETGWLSVVGLHWLSEGEQRFGSDPESDIVFPDKAPPLIGLLRVAEGEVTVIAEEGVGLTSEGEAVAELLLAPDDTGEATELELGSLLFYVIRRADRLGLRVKDRESAGLAGFTGIDRYPVDAAWRKEARFERYDEPRILKVPNVVGTVFDQPCEGAVVFEAMGETVRIDAISQADGELFLIFGDATNRTETYGAGRFLYTDPPTQDGLVVVDFNKAYNPPCAFTPFATCPLPPRQNKLAIAAEAGEKNYGRH